MGFLDESGFLLMPHLTRTWAPKAKAPSLKTAGTWTKVSAVSSLVVSPKHRHVRLLCRFHKANMKTAEVIAFLRYLLAHVRGEILLLWDRIPLHRAGKVKAFLKEHRRLHVAPFPAYAPELNPDEYVWTYLKASLANRLANDSPQLMQYLRTPLRKLQQSQALLWSRIRLSKLPWPELRAH